MQPGAATATDDVSAVVRSAIAIVLEVDAAKITATTALADIGADSLARVEIAEIVETELATRGDVRIRIPDDELGRFPTVGALIDYLRARV